MNKKRILSICMAFCLITSVVFGMQTEASAKTKTVKIVFNGKTITMGALRGYGAGQEPKTLSAAEKSLGKKTRLAKKGEEWAGSAYVWKKGQTKISIAKDSVSNKLGYASAEIKDKNGSINGIKVGMTKAKALEKMRKLYGKKNVTANKNAIYTSAIFFDIALKHGKVSSIFWFRS